MTLIAQPFRHPDSGIYYLQRVVPEDLRTVVGKVERRRSLRTRDHREAKAAFAAAYAESEKLFQQARQGGPLRLSQPSCRRPLPAPILCSLQPQTALGCRR